MIGIHLFHRDDEAALDMSAAVRELAFETGPHGFLALRAQLDMPRGAAYALAASRHSYRVEVWGDGAVLWHGRVEDLRPHEQGVALTALGFWRAFSDTLRTVFYISSGGRDWETATDHVLQQDAVNAFDVQVGSSSLSLGARKGVAYTDAIYGAAWSRVPERSERLINYVEFGYEFRMDAPWRVELHRLDAASESVGSTWGLTGNGALQTGTVTLAVTECYGLQFRLFYGSAVAAEYDADGDFCKVYDLVVSSVGGPDLTPEDVVAFEVARIREHNPGEVKEPVFEEESGLFLARAIWEDARPARIMDDLRDLTGVGVSVWEDGAVRYGRAPGRTWYIEIEAPVLEYSADDVFTDAYATWGTRGRTETASNEAARAAVGIRRVAVVKSDQSKSVAESARDVYLSNSAFPRPRADLRAISIWNSQFGPVPVYHLRAGDRAVVVNGAAAVGGATEFIVGSARYDAADNFVEVSPRRTPALEVI